MDKTVSMRCFDACNYVFAFPRFFLMSPKATLRKVFKWLFQFDYYPENREAIEFFDREFPVAIEDAEANIRETKHLLEKRSIEYQLEYRDLDPKSFKDCPTKKKQREERAARRLHNARLMDLLKDAKSAHENAKRDCERLKEIYALYQEAKG